MAQLVPVQDACNTMLRPHVRDPEKAHPLREEGEVDYSGLTAFAVPEPVKRNLTVADGQKVAWVPS